MKINFERLTRSLMTAGLITVTSVGLLGCASQSANVVTEEYEPVMAATEAPEVEAVEIELPYKTYESNAGWSVKYNPDMITVTEENSLVGFTYMGDCAGTCMVMVSEYEGTTAEETRDELAEMWGSSDSIVKTESTLADKTSYTVSMGCAGPAGSEYYDTAIALDNNGKTIVFECIEHMGAGEEIDMRVSDELANIVDSLEFH